MEVEKSRAEQRSDTNNSRLKQLTMKVRGMNVIKVDGCCYAANCTSAICVVIVFESFDLMRH